MIIETKRLILRHWEDSDAPKLFEMAKDPLVGPAAGWKPHSSVEESLDIIRTVFNSDLIFAMVLRDSNEVIGCVGLACDELLCRGTTEQLLGYWVGTQYWNKGYVTEAVEGVIKFGFNERHITRIWCGNYIENLASERVQEKSGFTLHHTETSTHWSDEERTISVTYLDNVM